MERLFLSGNRTGKSNAGAFECACHLTGLYPKWWTGKRFDRPTHGWACGTSGQVTRDIVQGLILGQGVRRGMIPSDLVVFRQSSRGITGAYESIGVKHVSGKASRLGFKSYEQGRKAYEGEALDFLWCIAEQEPVQMADGSLKKIEDVEVGDYVLSLDPRGRPVPRKVLNVVDRGYKECIEFWPKYGSPFVCTPDHKIYQTYKRPHKTPAFACRRVSQILPGWWPESTTDRDDAWYVWAALVVAEGYVEGKKITNGSIEVMEQAVAMLPEGAGARKQVFKNGHVPDWDLKWPEFWADWKWGKLSDTKEIPAWIFTSSLEKAQLFLRWLYMGDGWLSGHTIGYATTSRKLAQQLSILLLRLGIRSSVRKRVSTTDTWRDQYWVSISRSNDVLHFLNTIGIVGKEGSADRLRLEAERRVASKSHRAKHYVTHGLRDRVKFNDRTRQRASKVLSLYPVGSRRVYDITVEDEHRFLCGVSLVSNCDEEPPMDIYTEGLYRLLTLKGISFLTFTPLQGMSEVVVSFLEPESRGEIGQAAKLILEGGPEEEKDELDQEVPPSKYVVQAGWRDVPHLDKKTQKELIAATPPYQIQARIDGEPTLGSGAIYPIGVEDITVDTFKIPLTWRRCFGMDVGWERTAVVWGAEDPGNGRIVLYDEHYQSAGEPASHAAAILARGKWIQGVIDPAARGRSITDGRKLIETYQQLGLNVEPAINAVEAGITEVWQAFVSGQLKVQRHLVNFFREFAKYHRDERGHIVKKFDHLQDSCRYLWMSGRNRLTWQPRKDEYIKSHFQSNPDAWMM